MRQTTQGVLVQRLGLGWWPGRDRMTPLGLLVSVAAGLVLIKAVLYVAAAHLHGGAEQALCQWDCEWYVHTIRHGYDPEPRLRANSDLSNWAFFPLYPILGRLVRLVTGLSAFWSGTAVSMMAFAAFAVLSVPYRALTRREADQATWLTLLMVYPFSLYYFMVYTESLYLLLILLVLLAVRVGNFSGACVATSLAAATRPTGILVIPYLVAEGAWRAREAFRRGLVPSARLRVLADIALPLAIAPLGLVCYMAYLYHLLGDPLAFSHAQLSWDRVFVNPVKLLYWSLLKDDWRYLLDPVMPPSRDYCSLFVFVAAAACLWLAWRRLFLEAWLLGSTVLLALATSVESMPRYVMANPVFLLVVGDAVGLIRSRVARTGLAVASVFLQGFLLSQWMIGSTLLM
jgi:hypothetical protein